MIDPAIPAFLVALLLGLLGLTWGVLAVYVHDARPIVLRLIGYTTSVGLGFAVVSSQDLIEHPVRHVTGDALIILGVLLLCQGSSALWAVRLPRVPFLAVPLIGSAAMLWFRTVDPRIFVSAAAFMLTVAWLLAALPWYIFRLARKEFGAMAAWLLVGCGSGVAAALVELLLQACLTGRIHEVQLNQAGRFGTLAVMMSGIYASNVAFAFALVSRLVQRLDHLSRHDALTGLLNRRAMLETIQQEWERYRRHGTPFALLALDIDHFKRINDGHGHPMGDEVLRRLGKILGEALRRTDRLGRTGGEEFMVMLVGSDAASAATLAELVRHAVAQGPWPTELAAQGGVTVSIGLATTDSADRDMDDMLARADAALYRAKSTGRNRVVPSIAGSPAAAIVAAGAGYMTVH